MQTTKRTIPIKITITRRGKDLVFTKVYDLKIMDEIEHVETEFLVTRVPNKGDTINLIDLYSEFVFNEVY